MERVELFSKIMCFSIFWSSSKLFNAKIKFMLQILVLSCVSFYFTQTYYYFMSLSFCEFYCWFSCKSNTLFIHNVTGFLFKLNELHHTYSNVQFTGISISSCENSTICFNSWRLHEFGFLNLVLSSHSHARSFWVIN